MKITDVQIHVNATLCDFFTLSRLSMVQLLIEPQIDSKLILAKLSFKYINNALLLESVLEKFLGRKKKNFKWDDSLTQKIQLAIDNKNCNEIKELENLIIKDILFHLSLLKTNEFENNLLLVSIVDALLPILNSFEDTNFVAEKLDKNLCCLSEKTEKYIKVLYGPKTVDIDKSFQPSYNILDEETPEFSNDLEETVPYFWCLSLREVLASELCSLSIIEYDNLPLNYFWDFGKQALDEIRHAKIYLNLSISLFDNLKKELALDSVLLKTISDYEEGIGKLPIAKEKNMYEAVLNCELEERLILMHILTEAPAIGRLTNKMKMEICKRFPKIKTAFEFDKIDETFHARIGNSWLTYLIPESIERREKINDTKLLRGFLLYSSIGEYNELDLIELI